MSRPNPTCRYIDRLDYMLNGEGFTYDQVKHLWVVDVATGSARRLTSGRTPESSPAWSPDGRRIAFVANRRPDHDLLERSDIFVADAVTGEVTAVTRGPRSLFDHPTWLPDGSTIAALGHRLPAGSASRNDVWLFAADGGDAQPDGGRNLSAAHDLMPGSGMNSDVTTRRGGAARGLGGRPLAHVQRADRRLVRAVADRRRRRPRRAPHRGPPLHLGLGPRRRTCPPLPALLRQPRRPTCGCSSGPARHRAACRRSTRSSSRRSSCASPSNAGSPSRVARSRAGSSRAVPGRRPLVVEIHGGPHTLYGWSPFWEFQLLAANGMSVFACNPRGSEGYGEAFNVANYRDWGPGPTRDVLAGVDALVADGLADPDRLGVTGGSYGGYLTNWIVGHDQRFRAAMTCRSVSDMAMLMLTGDISTVEWARLDFGATPFEDPELFREISPLTYAAEIRTPLLIQHSERDIRTTIGQAEALFTALRQPAPAGQAHARPGRDP